MHKADKGRKSMTKRKPGRPRVPKRDVVKISALIARDVANNLAAEATEQGRSLSSQLRLIVAEWLHTHGYYCREE